MRKQLLISIGIILFLVIATIIVIIYGKGYTLDFSKGKPELSGTGLLVATSNPDGAQVIINGHLTTATNNTINLPPDVYTVEIKKEGYFSWKKTLKVQKEVVTKADALLLPTAPKLESITDLGVNNPVIDPSGTKIAFTVASQSAKNNGVYILNMNSAAPILTIQSSATQLADDTSDLFSQAQLQWSPDGQSILATINKNGLITNYLLTTGGINPTPQDVTTTLTNLLATWQKEIQTTETSQLASLRPTLRDIIKQHFRILSWSPDETKVLYQASQSATIPLIIIPPLIGSDNSPQQRDIEDGKVYVYDIKEDKNYKLDAAIKLDSASESIQPVSSQMQLPMQWLADSKHLLYLHDKKIEIMEYDSTNKTTVYAGPFIDGFAIPWPNGSKFVILTNLGNADIAPNLYTVGLK